MITRKEFYKNVIPNYKFIQRVKSEFSLSFDEYGFLLYFCSHEPCSKFRTLIIAELDTTLLHYKNITRRLIKKNLIIREGKLGEKNIYSVNYEFIAFTLYCVKQAPPVALPNEDIKRQIETIISKNKEIGMPNIPGEDVSESNTRYAKHTGGGMPNIPGEGEVGMPNIPGVGMPNIPLIISSNNNLKEDNNLNRDSAETVPPQKAKVKKPRIKKDIGEERKTFYNALIKRYFEILNTYAAPNFEADKVGFPSDLEVLINKRRAKPLITPERKEIPPLSTLEDWEIFIHKALSDDHKTGRNGKQWSCGLSWCIRKDENFAKIVATRPKESGVIAKANITSFEEAKDRIKGASPFGGNKKIVAMKKDENGGAYVAK